MPSLTDAYRRDGYAVVPGLADQVALSGLLADIDALCSLQLRRAGREPVPFSDHNALFANLKALFALDVAKYLAVARHAAKLASVQRLAVDSQVLRLVASLGLELPSLPTTPVLHFISDELRIPGGYQGLSPHQDWPSIQGALDSVIVWIPLMDVARDSFPVDVIPGSHTGGVWAGEITAHSYEIRSELYGDGDFTPVPLSAGDALLMSTFTVHRTRVKGCHGFRIAISTRYESSTEDTFVARGYPCAYKRTVEREFIDKDFPAQGQVAAVFAA